MWYYLRQKNKKEGGGRGFKVHLSTNVGRYIGGGVIHKKKFIKFKIFEKLFFVFGFFGVKKRFYGLKKQNINLNNSRETVLIIKTKNLLFSIKI